MKLHRELKGWNVLAKIILKVDNAIVVKKKSRIPIIRREQSQNQW